MSDPKPGETWQLTSKIVGKVVSFDKIPGVVVFEAADCAGGVTHVFTERTGFETTLTKLADAHSRWVNGDVALVISSCVPRFLRGGFWFAGEQLIGPTDFADSFGYKLIAREGKACRRVTSTEVEYL